MMTHPSSAAPLPVVPPLSAGTDSNQTAEPIDVTPFDRLLLGAQQSATPQAKPTAVSPAPTPKDRHLPSHPAQADDPSVDGERAALAEQLAQWLAQWLATHQTGQQVATKVNTAAAVQNSAMTVAASRTLATEVRAATGNLARLPVEVTTALNQISAHPDQTTCDLQAIVQLLDHGGAPDSDRAGRFAQRVAALLAQGKASELTEALSRLAPNDQTGALAQALSALTAEANAKEEATLPEEIAKWLKPLGVQKAASTGATEAVNTQITPWQKLLSEWSERRLVATASATTPPPAIETPTATSKKALPTDNPLLIPLDNAGKSETSEALPGAAPLPLTDSDGRLPLTAASPAEESLTVLNRIGQREETPFLAHGSPATPRPPSETIQTPVSQTIQWATETAERIVWHAGQAHEKVELALTPPHLGRIEVTLQLAHDQLTAQFVTASQATRDALDQAMPRLRELLQQAGIQLGQTFVADQGWGGDRQPSQPQPGSPATWGKEQANAPAVSAAENPSEKQRPTHDGLEAWA